MCSKRRCWRRRRVDVVGVGVGVVVGVDVVVDVGVGCNWKDVKGKSFNPSRLGGSEKYRERRSNSNNDVSSFTQMSLRWFRKSSSASRQVKLG